MFRCRGHLCLDAYQLCVVELLAAMFLAFIVLVVWVLLGVIVCREFFVLFVASSYYMLCS
jgi:hypothetical protein